jgi:queuine tRNA-ribosyltransferase
MPFQFRLEAGSGGARAGTLVTDHGEVPTPVFMPVGTQATVKATLPSQLRGPIGARIILGNTYHLVLRPGLELLDRFGGLHGFMGWDGPILTDSGGYQVFSLGDLRKIDDDGVTFRSHIDGSSHRFTPESVVEAQARIGADIIMSFDYCAAIPSGREEAERAVALTTDWARRGRDVYGTRFARDGTERVLFGIVQGAEYADLRARSLEEITALDFPGYAIGGLSVGEDKDVMWQVTDQVAQGLPRDRPRYLMGVGTPLDLVDGVARGVDMFDCVMPTRNARNGTVFTHDGRVVLRNARYAADEGPLEAGCGCETCATFSRGYLRHLFVAGEILGPVLATQHNLYFYCEIMREMRAAICDGSFEQWRDSFVSRYTADEGPVEGQRAG